MYLGGLLLPLKHVILAPIGCRIPVLFRMTVPLFLYVLMWDAKLAY